MRIDNHQEGSHRIHGACDKNCPGCGMTFSPCRDFCPKCGGELETREVVSMGPGYREWEDLTPVTRCVACKQA